MSIPAIVFLVIGAALTGIGVLGYTAPADASGLLASVAQTRTLWLFLGVLILLITIYQIILHRSSLKAQHIMSTTMRYIILVAVGLIMVYPLLWMIRARYSGESTQPNFVYIMYCGTFSTTWGRNSVDSSTANRIFLPRKLKRPKP